MKINFEWNKNQYLLIYSLISIAIAILHLFLLSLAPKYGEFLDHFDNICMGLTGIENGLFKVYSVPASDNPVIKGEVYDTKSGKMVIYSTSAPRVTNYPPLGVTIFAGSVLLLKTLDPQVTANTFLARFIMAIPSLIADALIILALFFICSLFWEKKNALIAALTGGLLPPIALNSVYWGQTDSWIIAVSLAIVYFLLKRRYILTGVICAIGLLLKPQVLLLSPVVLFSLFALSTENINGKRVFRINTFAVAILKTALPFFAAFFILSLPWTVSDGFKWFQYSYVENFSSYPYTTLNAFNFWYLLGLVSETPSFDLLNSRLPFLGMTPDTWGNIIVVIILICLFIFCYKKYKDNVKLSIIIFTGLWLFTTFMIPTRVHERYMIYALPFLFILALNYKKIWLLFLPFIVICSLETCNMNWIDMSLGLFNRDFADKIYSSMIHQYDLQSQDKNTIKPTYNDAINYYWKVYYDRRKQSIFLEWICTITAIITFLFLFFSLLKRRILIDPLNRETVDKEQFSKNIRK